MTIADIISPGDKIDIKLIQELEQKNEELAKIYKSQVLDILKNENIEIAMPIEGGKLILLPLGVRFEFIFYSMGTLYRAVGQIVERYKKENMYMLVVELKSRMEKFQRREFYRYECLMDVGYYILTDDEAEIGSGNPIFVQLQQTGAQDRYKMGQIMDLSGGGTKFCTEEPLNPGQHILMVLQLTNEKETKQYYILADIISCTKRERAKEKKFENRVKFLIDDDKIREEIIRYIFEEERKNRQREKR